MSYADYKRNGQYWDIFNSEASQIWSKRGRHRIRSIMYAKEFCRVLNHYKPA